MAKGSKKTDDESFNKSRPLSTVDGRMNQCIALSYDLVEKRLREGTASSQEVTHFLKLGTTMAKLEIEEKRNQNKLLEAKTKAIEADSNRDYAEVINAIKRYRGEIDEEDD